MKLKKTLYSIIIILSLANIVLTYKTYLYKQNTQKNILFKMNYDKLLRITNTIISYNNFDFVSDQKIINEKLDTLMFSGLINKSKLVLYFNEYSCMPCVDDVIQLLNKTKLIHKEDIIILSHYNNYRDMNVFAHINKLEIPIYNLMDQLKIPIASKNIPFLFTITKELSISNLLMENIH